MDCGIPFCNNGCPVNNVSFRTGTIWFTAAAGRQALDVLHSTNNFPDFTGRICPAPARLPVRSASTARWASSRSSISSSTRAGKWAGSCRSRPPQDRQEGRHRRFRPGRAWPRPSSWPASATTCDGVREIQPPRRFARFGIPDFKLNKSVIDRRVAQMEAEGVITFKTKVIVGDKNIPAGINNDATETVSADQLKTPISTR